MSIGENIRRLRNEAGLTQDQIFQQSGISTSYQSQIETGAVGNIGKKIMAKYCEALGVSELEIRFVHLLPHGIGREDRPYAIRRMEEVMQPLSEEKQLILLGKAMQWSKDDLL